ncbi:hypothetical protein BJF82_11740 [Kytococcus sp. CUA-901]|nr:hypothetical protein BJF82_11740 [Kytococcus sp. CUA-901]
MYIDGFNLYYGALKDTPHKWLNLVRFAEEMLPDYDIDLVAYCTARVKPTDRAPGANVRQDMYLRALGGLDGVQIHHGNFMRRPDYKEKLRDDKCSCCHMDPPGCRCCEGPTVRIMRVEEKGTDVQVGVQLVADGLQGRYDAALVVSGDSDLQPAINVVRQQANKRVIVADPRNRARRYLKAKEYRSITPAVLSAAQFPDEVVLPGGGVVRRPPGW